MLIFYKIHQRNYNRAGRSSPRIFISTSPMSRQPRSLDRWGWSGQKRAICIWAAKLRSHRRKASTATQMGSKWDSNQGGLKEWPKRWEHMRVLCTGMQNYLQCAPSSRFCFWPCAKKPFQFYHNSTSSSSSSSSNPLGKDKPWHQNSGRSTGDNSSLCRRRAEAWPGWTEGLLSGPASLSSCLNLCLYLCHTHNFNSAWKLT